MSYTHPCAARATATSTAAYLGRHSCALCRRSSLTAARARPQFRKYLERAGVIDALTKVLVALYEEAEKPANALE